MSLECLWFRTKDFLILNKGIMMAKTRDQKTQDLQKLVESINDAKLAVLTDYRGLDVSAINALRNAGREKGIRFTVAKNTLLKRAASESNKEITDLSIFTGPMAVAFGSDEVEAAKLIVDFSKTNSTVEVLGAISDTGAILSKEEVIALAKLPTRDQLLAQVVGTIAAPMSGLVRVLNGNLSGLVYALQAIKEKKEVAA
ncbi:MAG: 50S ribosomal protein L10 [bacterium]